MYLGPKMGNSLSGIPLTQMLVYALHHSCCSEVIDDQIIQLLTGTDQSDLDTVQKSHLDINILYLMYVSVAIVTNLTSTTLICHLVLLTYYSNLKVTYTF